MGCDIHLYVEKKIDGKWQIQGKLEDADDEGYREFSGPSFYDGRSYNLFAILADVRNGRGFAGVKTGEGFNPISEPRGVPDNASEEYRYMVEQWDCDGHSHSYHTLRQLLEYDWTQTSKLEGWLSMAEFEKWSRWDREHGEGPESYCGGVSGPHVKHISTQEAEALFESVPWPERESVVEKHANTYVHAGWELPYHKCARHFWFETIPKLLALAESAEHFDDVRIVFFFDN